MTQRLKIMQIDDQKLSKSHFEISYNRDNNSSPQLLEFRHVCHSRQIYAARVLNIRSFLAISLRVSCRRLWNAHSSLRFVFIPELRLENIESLFSLSAEEKRPSNTKYCRRIIKSSLSHFIVADSRFPVSTCSGRRGIANTW